MDPLAQTASKLQKLFPGVSLDPNRILRGKSFRTPTPRTDVTEIRDRGHPGLLISRKEKSILPSKMKKLETEMQETQKIPEVSVDQPQDE